MGIFKELAYQSKYPEQLTVPPMPKCGSAEKISKIDKTLIVLKCTSSLKSETIDTMQKRLLKEKSDGLVIIPDNFEVIYVGSDDLAIIKNGDKE